MTYDNSESIFLIMIVLIVVVYYYFCATDDVNTNNTHEQYVANFDSNMDLLILNDDSTNYYENKYVSNYMSVTEFTNMVFDIRRIIIAELVKFGKACQTINGDGPDKMIQQHLTFACYQSTEEIKEAIVLSISRYIIGYIRNRFGININPYHVINNFYINADLDEALLYPLFYPQVYTEFGNPAGIEYFTRNHAERMVNQNLKISDVLFTTFAQRGIIILIDNDQHIR